VAGCGGRPPRKLAGTTADVPLLGTALELERTLIALHEIGVELLTGRGARVAAVVLEHEHAHADALAEAMRELGVTPSPPRGASAYRRGLPRSGGAGAWRQFAIQFEEKAVAGYAASIPKLANPRLKATFAAIMTSEAEHAVALDVSQ
jgi:rubrerythrin